MVKTFKITTAVLLVSVFQSCGPTDTCLCSDGVEEKEFPKTGGLACSDLTPPPGFNFCFQPGSDHIVDPWAVGPVVTLEVPHEFPHSALGDAIERARRFTGRLSLGT